MKTTLQFLIVSTAIVFVAIPTTAAETKAETQRGVEVIVTADSEDAGFEPYRAMDGNPKTMWHTQFRGESPKLPHTLTVDLKAEYELKGFVVTPRTDNFNGVIGKYEIFVTNDPQQPVEPIIGEFAKEQKPNRVEFPEPKRGRFFVLKVLSEYGSGPYASVAELELLCDAAKFKARKVTALELQLEVLKEELGDADPERLSEFMRLSKDIKEKAKFDKIADETFLPDSLILDGDRDPVDVVLRRTVAMLTDLKTLDAAPEFSEQEKKLDAFRNETKTVLVEQKKKRFELFVRLCGLRREIMFSNPLLNFNELLFVKKHRATFNHMCDQYYGVNLPPGGGIYVLEKPFSNEQKLRRLIDEKTLPPGSFLSPDLSFDARKLAFAYVACEGDTEQRFHTDPTKGHWHEGRCFHIFTCNIDGSDLRQITDGTWNDFDPCWLPNGRLAFITERRGGYLRCGRECPTYTLFDMNPDGSGMRCLSYHETNEWQPSVTHDGRILYTRWDYPDRHGCTAHHPWITTLDGRDSRHVHGNFSPRKVRPDMELDCRMIPNSPKFVSTAAPHHGQAYGSLVLIDPRVEDDDAMGPVKRITPDVAFPESQGGSQVYGTPWPLSEKYYLAVADFSIDSAVGAEWHNRNYYRGDYGIYLVDAFGNKELIYRDPEIGCNSPMPILPRPTPPSPPQQIADTIEEQRYLLPMRDKIDSLPKGTVSIVNVYQSLRPWPEGTKLKELRVIQLVPMSVPSGRPPHEIGFREPTSLDSVVLARYVLGTVPIEEDGSVHFEVPPRRELMFQVLDEEGLAVQSMRSSTYLHDGEQLSCNGCHEPKTSAPLRVTSTPKAFQRAASKITPGHPDANPFSYPRLIQPILDKHCVDCHTGNRERGTPGVPNLAKEPIKKKWYASYNELVPSHGYYSYGEPLRTTPGKFGARVSQLYNMLKAGHNDVKLDADEMHRIALWLDCMSIFYGVYEKEGGEAQLRGEVVYPTLE